MFFDLNRIEKFIKKWQALIKKLFLSHFVA
jgi:hypothetical protein